MSEVQRAAPLLGGRYRIGTWLGGGGTADVYRAMDTRLERPVAIKLFRSNADANGRARFKDEARLLAGLNHPGLVAVHDAGASGNQLYVVMHLVEGKTLADLISHGPMPSDQVTQLGRQLAEVLDYVHGNGIVHRDVKPSNVLIAPDGQVYLTDFGISRLISAVGRMTDSGIIMGTATYMAPEQVLDKGIGYPVDIYALGLVLLECATGRVEFPGANTEAAVARLARQPEITDEVPGPLAGVLRVMTAREPEERPSAARCAELFAGDAVDASLVVRRSAKPLATSRPKFLARSADGSARRASPRTAIALLALPGLVVVAIILVLLRWPSDSAELSPQFRPTPGPPGTARLPGDLANLERLVRE